MEGMLVLHCLPSKLLMVGCLVHRAAPVSPRCHPSLPTLLQSPDIETAGAAFVTLMALMGDDAAASLSGAGAAANALLAVDSHFGLSAPVGAQALPACQLGCIPTDGQLMEALRANGYSPQPGRQQAQQQQQGAAAAAGGQQQRQEGDGPPKMQRIQTVKLILRTTASVCRYCAKVLCCRPMHCA